MSAAQTFLDLPRAVVPSGLPAVSLFSGAGGLDLGLEKAGQGQITTCAWVEKDADCRETIRANWAASGSQLFSDVAETDAGQIMASTGLLQGEAFLLAGGPPCQAFSTAGQRKGVSEERGRVVGHYFEMIRDLQPRFFVFENVRGLLSAAIKHRPYEERIASEKAKPGETLKLIA